MLKRANGFKSIFGAIRDFNGEPPTPGITVTVHVDYGITEITRLPDYARLQITVTDYEITVTLYSIPKLDELR
jgi:hypothetical protein